MSTLTKKDNYKIWLSHQSKEMSRRNFIINAGEATAATLLVPSLLAMLTSPRVAQAAIDFRPLVIFDCEGGGTFAKQVLPRDQVGNLLPAYDKLGMPNGFNPGTSPILSTYGAPVPSASLLGRALADNPAAFPILAPIGTLAPNVAASAAVKANLKIISICAPSADDSANNQMISSLAVSNLAVKLGAPMSVRSGLADGNTPSGGKSAPSQNIPGFKPAQANSLTAVQGLLSLKQGALTGFSDAQISSMVKLTTRLNDEQKSRLINMTSGAQLGAIAASAAKANEAKVASFNADPRVDASLTQEFSLTGLPDTDPRVIAAAQMKLVRDGQAPVLVRRLTGFDYHNQGVANWTARHQDLINQTMRVLNTMAAAGKSVMIHWNTDGATSNQFDNPTGDLGVNHSSIVFVLSMNGAPKPTSFQIGHFTTAQAAASTTDVAKGTNASNIGHAVFANLAAFQGVPLPADIVPTGLDSNVFNSFKKF